MWWCGYYYMLRSHGLFLVQCSTWMMDNCWVIMPLLFQFQFNVVGCYRFIVSLDVRITAVWIRGYCCMLCWRSFLFVDLTFNWKGGYLLWYDAVTVECSVGSHWLTYVQALAWWVDNCCVMMRLLLNAQLDVVDCFRFNVHLGDW